MNLQQPMVSEFNPYYQAYLDLVKSSSLQEALIAGKEETISFFMGIPKAKLDYSYSTGKWTPKDILQHIVDTERVFAYRALYFARTDNANLEGFDEDTFASNALAASKSLSQLLNEYKCVRSSTISLFKSFDHIQLMKFGMANGSNMSVRAVGFVICGHEIHHCNIIKERYLI